MNKNESKYFKSAEKMQSALISLLDKKEYEMITVKGICEEAGVNRSTFYLHYDNISDLLTETVESIYKDFFNRFSSVEYKEVDIRAGNEEELFLIKPKYLMPYLAFVEDNRKIFRIMYEKGDQMGAEKMYATWFSEIFGPILTRFGVSEKEQPLIMIFYLKGLMGLITEWIKGDCSIPKNELMAVIQKCIIRP